MELRQPEQVSNYDKVIEEWRLRFQQMNQEEIIGKFHLKSDENALYLHGYL